MDSDFFSILGYYRKCDGDGKMVIIDKIVMTAQIEIAQRNYYLYVLKLLIDAYASNACICVKTPRDCQVIY